MLSISAAYGQETEPKPSFFPGSWGTGSTVFDIASIKDGVVTGKYLGRGTWYPFGAEWAPKKTAGAYFRDGWLIVNSPSAGVTYRLNFSSDGKILSGTRSARYGESNQGTQPVIFKRAN
jgi:hypothetical protein